VIAYYGNGEFDSDCFPLWIEAQLLTRQDNLFGERLDVLRHETLFHISNCLRTFVHDADRLWSGGADALAVALMGLCDGIQFFRMCNARTGTDRAIQSVLAELAECVPWQKLEEKRSGANLVRGTA